MSKRSEATRFSATRQPGRRPKGPRRAKALRGTGLPRLYQDHRTYEGIIYRRHLQTLGEAFDLTQPLARVLAGGAAAHYVTWLQLNHGLSVAQGTSRREYFRRRRALEWKSYRETLDRLGELVGKNGHATPDQLLDRVHQAMKAERHGD